MSLISLVGLATLSMNQARMRPLAAWLVSFATGALLGDAFLHLIIGDAIHNFIDGVLIGASYLVSSTLGLSTTIAVIAARDSSGAR